MLPKNSADAYQQLAARTLWDKPGREIPTEEIMLVWNAIGLAGEAGEVAELIKKSVFHQHPLDRDKAIKELGDCCWYIAALCTVLDIDFSTVLEANIDKLKERYPDGFSIADSINRKDRQQPRSEDTGLQANHLKPC